MPSSRAASLALAIALSAAGCDRSTWLALWGLSPRQWPPPRAGYVNPIPGENALAGDPHWADGPDAAAREIEGYADRISARGGDTISVQVSSSAASTATWTLYRLGDYGGAGARNVASGGPVSVSPQPACPMEAGTGLVRCSWPTTFKVYVDTQSVSGLYALKLTRADGNTRFVPLIVTDDRAADLMMQASVQTYEAYNAWGGESLYHDASGTLPNGRAVKVSFDRPFDSERGLGQLLFREAAMSRFLEKFGYDVTYGTNLDVGRDAAFIQRAGMFLSVGHDEYWSGSERAVVDAARDAGVSLAFFSANTGYWKVRYEDYDARRVPHTMACYKSSEDPLGVTASGLFRGPAINQPENALLGVMVDTGQDFSFPLVVSNASLWLYDGTGLSTNDTLPGLVGYEFDRRYPDGVEPDGLMVLAHSPIVDNLGRPNSSDAVSYRTAAGAFVFSSGTMNWSRGLDPNDVIDFDPRVERMTANVFHEGLDVAIPSGLSLGTPKQQPSAAWGPVDASTITLAARIEGAAGIAVVPTTAAEAGGLVVSSPGSAQIFAVDAIAGRSQIIAGDGTISSDPAFDNLPGAIARFHYPVALALDAGGTIYVADSGASAIRRIDSGPQRITTTLAGRIGAPGNVDGPAMTARFSRPQGIAVSQDGSSLYIADTGNQTIRAVSLTTGMVSTIAGSTEGDRDGPGATARFDYPTGIAVGPDGTVFVLSSTSFKVKAILADNDHTVVTIAGSGEGFQDGSGSMARLSPQAGIAWVAGFLAISDPASRRVRSLSPATSASATLVNTLAFSGTPGDATGEVRQARISLPMGIACIGQTIYVVDGALGEIRAITLAR